MATYTPEHGDIYALSDRGEMGLQVQGNKFSFHPNPWFVAGQAIAKDTFVSIVSTGGVAQVFPTNSSNVAQTVGVTLTSSSGAGQPIEVLCYGNYTFNAPTITVTYTSTPSGTIFINGTTYTLPGTGITNSATLATAIVNLNVSGTTGYTITAVSNVLTFTPIQSGTPYNSALFAVGTATGFTWASTPFATTDIGLPAYLAPYGSSPQLTTNRTLALTGYDVLIEAGIVTGFNSIYLDFQGDVRNAENLAQITITAGEDIPANGVPLLISMGLDGNGYVADRRKVYNNRIPTVTLNAAADPFTFTYNYNVAQNICQITITSVPASTGTVILMGQNVTFASGDIVSTTTVATKLATTVLSGYTFSSTTNVVTITQTTLSTVQNRNLAYGFLAGSQYGTSPGLAGVIPSGTPLVLQKLGILTNSNFSFSGSLGLTAYLDILGAYTLNPANLTFYSDSVQEVGVTKDNTNIFVLVPSLSLTQPNTPIGTMIKQVNASADADWLTANGASLSTSTYANLFGAIGYTYGGSGGSFNLPNYTSPQLQIKYQNSYLNTIPTSTVPIYRYDSGWLTYNQGTTPGTSIVLPTTNWGYDPPLTDFWVTVYAYDGSSNYYKIEPGIMLTTDIGAPTVYSRYNYTITKTTANQLNIIVGKSGLAYFNPSVALPQSGGSTNGAYVQLSTGWTYRILAYKAEQFNRYYDYTNDQKMSQLWSLGLVSITSSTTTPGVGYFDLSGTDPVSNLTQRLNFTGQFYPSSLKTRKATVDTTGDTQTVYSNIDTASDSLSNVGIFTTGGSAQRLDKYVDTQADLGTANTIYNLKPAIANISANANTSKRGLDMHNVGLGGTVGSSALTVSLLQSDGVSNPSTGAGQVKITFRNSTITTGGVTEVIATSAISLTVISGATLGSSSGYAYTIYVYAVNNAGTIVVGVVGQTDQAFEESGIYNTTAMGASNSPGVLYTSAALTGVAIRKIGTITITEATAGTWITAPSKVTPVPFLFPVGQTSTQYATMLRVLKKADNKAVFRELNKKDKRYFVKRWWSSATSTTQNWEAVAWSPELSLFCMISDSSSVAAISPDGVNWTNVSMPTSQYWTSICWSAELGLFCAVGQGASAGTSSTVAATSPDGINWTSRTMPSSQPWVTVIWAAELGLFCAVAGNGTASTTSATSPDGITWTARTLPSSSSWTSVCWSAELGIFCAVAGGPSTVAATSPDGITWTARTLSSSQSWNVVKWSAELGLFCTSGQGTTIVSTSPDGINWTSRNLPSSQSWNTLIWAAELGVFLIMAQGTTITASSTDGIVWAPFTIPSIGTTTYKSGIWAPDIGTFLIPISGNRRAARSVALREF